MFTFSDRDLVEVFVHLAIFCIFWTVNLACVCGFFVAVLLIARRVLGPAKPKAAPEGTAPAPWGPRIKRRLVRPLPLAFMAVFLLFSAFKFIDPLRAWWFLGLIKTMGTTNEEVWECVACYHLKNEGGARRLGRIALDTDSQYRLSALHAMYYFHEPIPTDARDKAILPAAARLLHDPDPKIRKAAVKVLITVNPKCERQFAILADAVGTMVADCLEDAMRGIVYHAGRQPEDRPLLVQVLNDPSPAVWQAAMKQMADVRWKNPTWKDPIDQELVAVLFCECLPDPSHEQKLMLIKLFTWGHHGSAPKVLAPLLDDKSQGLTRDEVEGISGVPAGNGRQKNAAPDRICDNVYIILSRHLPEDKSDRWSVAHPRDMDSRIAELKRRLAAKSEYR
jgi:hypothetical protein